MVTKKSGAEQVHIIAHSMGNLALLNALTLMKAERKGQPDQSLKINELIMAAPDVSRDNFETLTSRLKGSVGGMTLYASGADWALKASEHLRGGVTRAGEVPKPPEGPLVVSGLDTIDVTKASTEFFGFNHTTFAQRQQLLSDIQKLLRTSLRPPSVRSSDIYRGVKTTKGTYWEYSTP